jgi:hypothetical protein
VLRAALRSRWAALTSADAVLIVAADDASARSFRAEAWAGVRTETALVNPLALAAPPDTPRRCGWDDAGGWQAAACTDRWARLLFALEVGVCLPAETWMLSPALDAVWGARLLPHLLRFAELHSARGLPAAVSPFTPHQHTTPGADPKAARVVNATVTRDPALRHRIEHNRIQALWGKTMLLPCGLCAALLAGCDRTIFEDDAAVSAAVEAAGYGARCLWMDDAAEYRLTPPIFTQADAEAMVERHIHYGLHIPVTDIGGSWLVLPLGDEARARAAHDPAYAQDQAALEGVVASVAGGIRARLGAHGVSWVDWGAYRHVAAVGEPGVEVWKRPGLSATMSR